MVTAYLSNLILCFSFFHFHYTFSLVLFLYFYAVAFLTKMATFSNLPSALFDLNVLKCARKSLSKLLRILLSLLHTALSKSNNLPLT